MRDNELNGLQKTVEELEQAIIGISNGMRKLEQSRLNRRAIVLLIHAHSKVGIKDIELVLNNLEQMDETWLKPTQEAG